MSSTPSCAFDAESHFGPSVSPCRRTFDFTLYFEEVVFLLIPSCVFILLAAIRLLFLIRRPRQVSTTTTSSTAHTCGNKTSSQQPNSVYGRTHHHVLRQVSKHP